MGDIADMMLDGTMDPETGEFNFDGEDGPGFPMTGAEAAAYDRDDVFVCDGCGLAFPCNERAEVGEPFCVTCWDAMEDGEPTHD